MIAGAPRRSRAQRARAAVRALGWASVVAALVASGSSQASAAPSAASASSRRASRKPPVAEPEPPPPPPPSPDADAPTIEVVTFGPGNHPFSRFGHNALRVVDPVTKTDLVYNFGTFSFNSPRMLQEFLRKTLRYWLSRARTSFVLGEYQRENRSIAIQHIDLPADDRRALARRLVENALPANRDYQYDYFRDNCSTRVRDALDVALGGRLHALGSAPGRLTLRQHALRMAADDPAFYLALLIVLGPSTDQPLDRWGEEFLPEMLQAALREVRLYGPERPLVSSEQVVFTPLRAAPRKDPPRWKGRFMLGGAAIGGSLLGLAALVRRARGAGRRGLSIVLRIVFAVETFLLGTLCGFIGCFLLYAWLVTPHAVTYRNQNLLLFAPFLALLFVIAPMVGAGSRFGLRALGWIAWAAVATTVAALIFKLPGLPHQENAPLIYAMLPLWLGLALGARTLGAPAIEERAR